MSQQAAMPMAGAWARTRFEVIPIAGVDEQAARLPLGAVVTVTCSPARGMENTLDCAARLAARGYHVVPHLSARLVRDEAHLRAIVQRLGLLDVREVFVIGGDVKEPAGAFTGAPDLLRALARLEHGFTEIGIAAYPERHPFIDEATLQRALLEKQRVATYMVTQICFNAETILRWLDGTRRAGITLPVYIGVPGAIDSARLLRIAMKIGVGDSLRFLSKQGGLAARLLAPGRYRPTTLLDQLAPAAEAPLYNIRGLHVNTFNQIESTDEKR